MNMNLCGKVRPLYVAIDGSLQYAAEGYIPEDWGEIIIGLENGDLFSMLRNTDMKTEQAKILLKVGGEYHFEIRFDVTMCNRSGQNMTILTATALRYERVEK